MAKTKRVYEPKKGTRAWVRREAKQFIKRSLMVRGFMSPAIAAKIMGVSRQRVNQAMGQSCKTSIKSEIFFDRPFIPVLAFESLCDEVVEEMKKH